MCAIGYVEYYFARQHHLSDAAVRNRDGQFVKAGTDSFRAAAAATDWSSAADIRQLPTDAPGAESWPITGASFILISRAPQNAAQARAVLRFFDWGLHQGETAIDALDYIPIPSGVLDGLPTLWHMVRDHAGQSVWP